MIRFHFSQVVNKGTGVLDLPLTITEYLVNFLGDASPLPSEIRASTFKLHKIAVIYTVIEISNSFKGQKSASSFVVLM